MDIVLEAEILAIVDEDREARLAGDIRGYRGLVKRNKVQLRF